MDPIDRDPLVTRLAPHACPACGHVINAVSNFETAIGPAAGDFSVCMRCAAALTFTADLTLRCLTMAELVALPNENFLEVATFQRRVRMLHCAHVFPAGGDRCEQCGVTRDMLARAPRPAEP